MSVSIVTPWFNHVELLDDYLLATGGSDAEVVVVDDGSDPALDFAAVRLETNQGFCRACNAGLASSTGEKVVFLNNDVASLDSSWLEKLIARIEPGVLAGAALRTEPHARVAGISDPLTYLDGWCIGGMREDFEMLGGWAEDYEEPAYFSDNDLCLRARCLGMKLREVRIPELEHKLSTTTLDLFPEDEKSDEYEPHPNLQALMTSNYHIYSRRVHQLLATVMA